MKEVIKINGFNLDAEVMTEAEFEAIKKNEETPSMVKVGERYFYNQYTCHSGYSGTCRCFHHPMKEWVEYLPQTDEFKPYFVM